MSEQLTELQIAIAHQQRLCEQLNEVVTEHTRQLMRLERETADFKKQLSEFRELRKSDQTGPGDEKPPHY